MTNTQQYNDGTQETNPVDRQTRNLGKARLMDENEVLINPATEETLSSTLSREIAVWSAGTLPVEQQSPVAVEDSTGTQIDPATDGTLSSTLSREIAAWSAGALPVEQQTPVGLEDTTGTQIDPDQAPNYPESEHQQDLTSGDLTVGPVSVARAEAVLISATSADGNSWSASVTWKDSTGNTLQSESSTDVGLDTVTEDWAQLVRKGAQVSVTFTDESGAASNNLNAYIDVHR